MAVKFFSGFETGDLSEWTVLTAASVTTASPNSGKYCASGSAVTTPTGLNLATCCARMSFRINAAAAPVSQTADDCLEMATTTTVVLGIALVSNTDGTYALRLLNGNSGGINTTTVGSDFPVSAGQWITVEAKRVASTQALEMRVNGTVGASGTGTQGTANVDNVFVNGNHLAVSDLDDVVIDDANYPGNAKVIARQAAASQAPTYDTFTKSTGGNIGTVWNDTPFNATTNANKATTGGAQTMNVFSFGSAQTGHGSEVIAAGDTILGAKAAVIEKTSATSSGGSSSSIRRRIAGVDVDLAITLTTSDKYFESAIFVDTLANLNAMQVGVLKGSTTRTHTVEDAWAMVVYRPTIAPVSGTATSSQASQTQADAGKETVRGTATASQTAQSEAAAGTVTAATHVTGTATSAQAVQSEALAAKETIRATATEAQAAQTEAVAGKETIRATVAESQAQQTETIAAKEKFTGTATESQAAQTEAIAAVEKFVGTETSAQQAQAESAAGTETLSASAASAQARQSEAVVAVETITATAASNQAQQEETAVGALLITPIGLTPTAGQQVTLRFDVSTTVDWGDGSPHSTSTGTSGITHTYASSAPRSLVISGNPVWFICDRSQLTALDVSSLTALQLLDCDTNKLSALNLSGLSALTSLRCDSTGITALNLSGCTSLSVLDCSDNNLISLDVSPCIALSELYCYRNYSLTSLDVSANQMLTDLECNLSSLTSLDVSGLTALLTLYCDNNLLAAGAVNAVLAALVANGATGGTVDLSSNNAPTGQGLTDVTTLQSRSWTVTVDTSSSIVGTAVQAQSAQQETAAGTETIVGSITAAQAPQTLAAVGTLHIAGSVIAAQAPQSTVASSAGAISGTVESIQASQLQLVSGTAVVPVVPTTAGGGWNVPLTVRQPAKRPMVIAGYAVQQQAKQAQSALGSFTFVMKNPTDEELLLLLLGGVA